MPCGRRHRPRAGRRLVVDGTITSLAFASGDRFAVGCWPVSPLGPMVDVMWVDAVDRRHLLAPDDEVAAFVSAIYDFEDVVVVPMRLRGDDPGRRLELEAGPLRLSARAGRGLWLPAVVRRRPAWLTHRIESPLARALLGVRTAGVSGRGVGEWYQASGFRPVAEATASLDGVDLGRLGRVEPPLGVGFSEPPRRPSVVGLRTLIDWPAGLALPVRSAAG